MQVLPLSRACVHMTLSVISGRDSVIMYNAHAPQWSAATYRDQLRIQASCPLPQTDDRLKKSCKSIAVIVTQCFDVGND